MEDKKSALLDKIIQATNKIDQNNPIIAELESAKNETQFSKAVDSVKSTFPQGLLINGENPLKLLHGALSQGIHNLSDDDCLSLAISVRVVLTELIERMNQLMKEDQEITSAINVLKNPAALKPAS